MQVGEFCSDKINAMDATPFAMALGTLYSVPNINSPEEIIGHVIGQAPRQCRVAIECKGNGDQTQLQMRFRGWTNFHPWQRIDNKKLDPSQFSKIGVYTNEWFRAGMLEFMTKMLKDNELEICSPFFVREMASLESRLDVQKIGAADGEHDDRFFSLGFIVISLYQWEKDRPVSFSRPQPKQDQVRRYAVSPLNVQERPYGIE